MNLKARTYSFLCKLFSLSCIEHENVENFLLFTECSNHGNVPAPPIACIQKIHDDIWEHESLPSRRTIYLRVLNLENSFFLSHDLHSWKNSRLFSNLDDSTVGISNLILFSSNSKLGKSSPETSNLDKFYFLFGRISCLETKNWKNWILLGIEIWTWKSSFFFSEVSN